jgi:hypothetical protein
MQRFLHASLNVCTVSIAVPPSAALDDTLAPFLPPYVLQAQIEGTVAMYENLNPAYWPSDCRLARRAYMCGAYFRYCTTMRTMCDTRS